MKAQAETGGDGRNAPRRTDPSCPGAATPEPAGRRWSSAALVALAAPAVLAISLLLLPAHPAEAADGARNGNMAGSAPADLTLHRTPDGLIAAGSRAPDFVLPDPAGKPVQLREFLGKPMILYFYPMDETPGCTTEACAFRDDISQFDSLGVRVVGISVDRPASHRSFAERHQLPFTLLSDTLATVCRLYGVAFDIQMGGSKRTIARRVTYLIDGDGVVRQVWPKVDPASSSMEVRAAIAKLMPKKKP